MKVTGQLQTQTGAVQYREEVGRRGGDIGAQGAFEVFPLHRCRVDREVSRICKGGSDVTDKSVVGSITWKRDLEAERDRAI